MASASGRLSLWAIASLVCSLLGCPPLCVIGVLLGAIALVEIRRRPGTGGRRIAVAGLAIGLAWCAVWGAGAAWWHVRVRTPMLEGPVAPLRAGLDGDVAAFRAAFTDSGPGDGAEAFLAAVRARHGAVRGARPRQPDGAPSGRPPALDHVAVSYDLDFERGTVPADAVFVIRRPGDGWVLAWRSLALRDADAGDLVYPDAASP